MTNGWWATTYPNDRGNAARLKRAIKAWTRQALGISGKISAARVELERIFDVEGVAPDYKRILEDNFQLYHAYIPKPYPGRIVLFRARTRQLLHSFERDLNWGELVAGGVEIIDLPGSHDTFLNETNMRTIAARIAQQVSENLETTPERTGSNPVFG